jgi:hypothetical protein
MVPSLKISKHNFEVTYKTQMQKLYLNNVSSEDLTPKPPQKLGDESQVRTSPPCPLSCEERGTVLGNN